MIELLKLTRQFGQERLRFAIETALETGCTDAAAVHHLRSEPADFRSNRYWRTGTISADWNDIGGRCPWAELGAEFLFQVIAERAEKTPVVLTTNLPFSEWTQVIPMVGSAKHCSIASQIGRTS